MADSTSRLNIPYPEGGDSPPDVAQALADLSARLDAVTMGRDQGPIASRGPAGNSGRMYWSTSPGVDGGMSYDNGVGWQAIPGPGLIPIGGVMDWPWSTEPPGPAEWVEADGRTVTRAAYPELFDAVGVAGETLTVPDRRGRSPMGAGQGPGLRNRIVRDLVGGETVRLQTQHLPAHTHGASTGGAGAHDHGGATGGGGGHQHSHNVYGWSQVWGYTGVEAPGGPNYMIRGPFETPAALTSFVSDHGHGIPGVGNHTHTVTVLSSPAATADVDLVHPVQVTRYFVRVR